MATIIWSAGDLFADCFSDTQFHKFLGYLPFSFYCRIIVRFDRYQDFKNLSVYWLDKRPKISYNEEIMYLVTLL